jgi:hypothetical protein
MIILTRPEHDLTTKYISLWAEEIIDFAHKKGFEIIDLKKEKANQKELVGRIKKLKPRLIFLNGHGNNDCVTGHDNEVLIQRNVNHDILKGKIVYALSCKSGKGLGESIKEYGNSAYIGYGDDFIFIMDTDFAFKPLDDPKAMPFKEASNQVMISLLKGNGAGEASKRSKDKFNSNYSKLLASNNDIDSLNMAKYLWWNERNQICLGDRQAIYG